jgi:prophage tail gpP-like protein
MAATPIFHGRVDENGTLLLLDDEKSVREAYQRRLAGKAVDVTIKVHRDQRSLDQNAWHWGVAIPILADALGYDKDEHDDLHYALVDECFGTHFEFRLQREVPNVRSSKLSTEKFSQFMEWEVRWAAKQGIVIPLPNESEAA